MGLKDITCSMSSQVLATRPSPFSQLSEQLASHLRFPHSGSPCTKSREIREPTRGKARITGKGVTRGRLGTGNLSAGLRHQPVPEPSRSPAPRQPHERRPLLNLSQRTFRAGIPALNLLPGPPGRAGRLPAVAPATSVRPSGLHSFRWAPGAAPRRAAGLRGPLRALGKAGLGSASARAPGEGWAGQRAGRGASDTPAHPPAHARSGPGKKATRAERSSAQPGREAGAPPLGPREPFAP